MENIGSYYGANMMHSTPNYSAPITETAYPEATPEAPTVEDVFAEQLAAEPQGIIQDFETLSKSIATLYTAQAKFPQDSPVYQQLEKRIEALQIKRAQAMKELGSEIGELAPQQKPHMQAVSPLELEIRRTSEENRRELNVPPISYSEPLPPGSYSTDLANLNSEVDDVSHLNRSQLKITSLQQLNDARRQIQNLLSKLDVASPTYGSAKQRLNVVEEAMVNLSKQMSPQELAMVDANINAKDAEQALIRADGGSDTQAHGNSLKLIKALGQIRQSIGNAMNMKGLPESSVEKRLEILKHTEASILEQMSPEARSVAGTQLQQVHAEDNLLKSQA
jgi:hypothetical protein